MHTLMPAPGWGFDDLWFNPLLGGANLRLLRHMPCFAKAAAFAAKDLLYIPTCLDVYPV